MEATGNTESNSSAQKIAGVRFSETSIHFNEIALRNIPRVRTRVLIFVTCLMALSADQTMWTRMGRSLVNSELGALIEVTISDSSWRDSQKS
jgi:hypothetical protein